MAHGRSDARGRTPLEPLDRDRVIRPLVRRRIDARGIVVPIALAAGWIAASMTRHWDPHLLVPPAQLAHGFVATARNGDFWMAAGSSVLRLLTGWLAGSVLGVALGLVVGYSAVAEQIVAPSLDALRQVPLFAWIPLLTAWFGGGNTAEVILVALAAFFPAALNTEAGCRDTPIVLREVGLVLEFGPREILRRVIIPSAMPSIAAGLQIALTSAWIGTIGAEYLIDQGNGLGVFLSSARMDDRMDVVLFCIVALGCIGFFLSAALRLAFAGGTPALALAAVDD
jgi:sulfonate transport system permease protein